MIQGMMHQRRGPRPTKRHNKVKLESKLRRTKTDNRAGHHLRVPKITKRNNWISNTSRPWSSQRTSRTYESSTWTWWKTKQMHMQLTCKSSSMARTSENNSSKRKITDRVSHLFTSMIMCYYFYDFELSILKGLMKFWIIWDTSGGEFCIVYLLKCSKLLIFII